MNIRGIHSIRFKLPLVVLAVTMPLLAFLAYFSVYSVNVVREQVAQSNRNMMSLYMDQIDNQLTEVDTYIANTASSESDVMIMSGGDKENYLLSKIRLSNRLSKEVSLYKIVDTLFVYSGGRDDLFYVYNEGVDGRERLKINTELRKQLRGQNGLENGFTSIGWYSERIDGSYYLFRVFKAGDIYLGAWLHIDKLSIPLTLVNLGENGGAMFVGENGEVISSGPVKLDERIDLNAGLQAYDLAGDEEQYLIVGKQSSHGGFSLIAAIPQSTILEHLPFMRRVVVWIAIGAVILLPLGLYMIRRTVLLPIHRIVTAMKLTRDGYMEYRIQSSRTSDEFKLVNETFNEMMDQIQTLKINVYEEQLSKQKAEIRQLQLQISPHFLLNAFNLLYGLAQMKKFDVIQEMIMSLANYFRYMLRSNAPLVALKDEVKHAENYMHIQMLRMPGSMTYDVEVPEYLMNVQVPPLMVQTFIENIVKHAITPGEGIQVRISAELIEIGELPFVRIHITDTGKGFDAQRLTRLVEDTEHQTDKDEHIGIWNVQRRLRLMFQERAALTFANYGQGAHVQITLPMHHEAS